MNDSIGQSFGCVPANDFAKFSLFSQNPQQFEILNDIRSFLYPVSQLKEYQRKEALTQRIDLLAQVAIVTGDGSFIQTANNLANIYIHLNPSRCQLETSCSILQNFNREWINELKKIRFLWQRSRSFKSMVTKSVGKETQCLLNSLFSQQTQILLAQKAYRINEMVRHLLPLWEDTDNTDYGYLPIQVASELEEIEEANDSLRAEWLFQTEEILKKIKIYRSLSNQEAVLFQISRRIIALAASALLTGNSTYLAYAKNMTEIVKKITQYQTEDLNHAIQFNDEANAIFTSKPPFKSTWKTKLGKLKRDVEQSQQMQDFLHGRKIATEIFSKKDLSFVILIYHEYKKSRRCLKLRFHEEKKHRSRSGSFESGRSDESGHFDAFGDPRPEGLSDMTNHLIEEEHPYDSLLFGDNDSDEEFDKRKKAHRAQKEGRLENWLRDCYPVVYKCYLNQSKGIFLFLKDNDTKYNKQLLEDFKEVERRRKLKKFERILPTCESEECLFHSRDDHRRIHLQKLSQDHRFNFKLFGFFLTREPGIVAGYLEDTHCHSFFKFIKKNYPEKFLQATSERHIKTLRNTKPFSEQEKGGVLVRNGLSENDFIRSKEYAYLLHANRKLKTEFSAMLSLFYSSPLGTDYQEKSSEIPLLKLGKDIPGVISRLESENDEVRIRMLKIMDHLYAKVPDIFCMKREKVH
ncbi:MAG: hypothetical protein ACSNEK_00455 [Parachlamydiaceae bacterium]